MQAARAAGGFVSFPEPMQGTKVRGRSEKFLDHFSQAALFYNSQSEPEKDHIVEALRFELGKVERAAIRERMVGHAQPGRCDAGRARRRRAWAFPPTRRSSCPLNRSLPAGEDPKARQPGPIKNAVDRSDPLSMANTVKDTIATRKVAILAADGVDEASLTRMVKALTSAGRRGQDRGPAARLPEGIGRRGVPDRLQPAHRLLGPVRRRLRAGWERSVRALAAERDAVEFVTEAYRHCKAIAATGEGADLIAACPGIPSTPPDGEAADPALIVGDNGQTAASSRRVHPGDRPAPELDTTGQEPARAVAGRGAPRRRSASLIRPAGREAHAAGLIHSARRAEAASTLAARRAGT